jgi:hypothetical protein
MRSIRHSVTVTTLDPLIPSNTVIYDDSDYAGQEISHIFKNRFHTTSPLQRSFHNLLYNGGSQDVLCGSQGIGDPFPDGWIHFRND